MVLLARCGEDNGQHPKKVQQVKVVKTITALPISVQAPVDNPTTSEKVALGRLLFYDPILSGNKDVACASCHHPNNGYAEYLDISIGVNGQGLGSKRSFRAGNDIPFVKRNSQTILNSAFNGIVSYRPYHPDEAPMFWDVRVESLESQALEPIKTMEEMMGRDIGADEILDVVVRRLNRIPEYSDLFENVFGSTNAVSSDNIGKAIAAFERTLVTNNSRFDQYMRGDKDAISLGEKDGFALFKKAGCDNCHNGPMFSDYKIHVLGVPENGKLSEPDYGVDSSFAFRTPSLRNLRYTAPYMHSGHFNTLKSVLEFYEDISFRKVLNPNISKDQLDPLVKELDITVKDMSLIISFLNTLNDSNFDKEIPERVPSGLPVGGNIH